MSKKSLQRKVAFVTGASAGIGDATAVALASHGAKVAVAARRLDRLDALTRRIQDGGWEALPLECDVADVKQVSRAVQAVLEKWGRLDVLVNSAGVPVDWGRFWVRIRRSGGGHLT